MTCISIRARALLSVLVITGGCSLTQPTPDGWRRVEGILLPAEVGTYDLQRVEPLRPVELGSAARYAVPKDEPVLLPAFDVFVYPMGGRELAEEAALAREQVRNWDAFDPDLSATTIAPTIETAPVYGEYPMYMTRISARHLGEPVCSFMWITRAGQRFVKVRASYAGTPSHRVDRALIRNVELLLNDLARQAAQ